MLALILVGFLSIFIFWFARKQPSAVIVLVIVMFSLEQWLQVHSSVFQTSGGELVFRREDVAGGGGQHHAAGPLRIAKDDIMLFSR